MLNVAILATVVIAILCAYSDVRTRRIPNVLTGALVIIALVAHGSRGLPDLFSTLAVMAIVFCVGTLLFSFGWFGGGDVKMLAACCGIAGASGWASVVAYTLIAGGVFSVVEAVRLGRLRSLLRGTILMTTGGVAEKHVTLPYGVAIAAGVSCFALSITLIPSLRLHL